MKLTRRNQTGGGAVGNVLIILVVAFGVYVGIHYAPLFIESRTMDSILNNVRLANMTAPAQSMRDAQQMIDKQLMINGMTHMQDSFQIRRMGGGYEIQVRYDRTLDLLFEEKTIEFRKGLVLQ